MVDSIEMKPGRNRPRRVRARFAIFGATAALAFVAMVPVAWSDSSSAAAKPPAKPLLTVRARIRVILSGESQTPLAVFFTPTTINVGTVIIIARNSDNEMHQLIINGVTSRWMGPGSGTAVLKVRFKRPGTYAATVTGGLDNGKS